VPEDKVHLYERLIDAVPEVEAKSNFL